MVGIDPATATSLVGRANHCGTLPLREGEKKDGQGYGILDTIHGVCPVLIKKDKWMNKTIDIIQKQFDLLISYPVFSLGPISVIQIKS